MVRLWYHNVLLEIQTFWVDRSIRLRLLMESWLFCGGNLPEILLFHFGSPALQGHMGTKMLQASILSTLEKQSLLEMARFFVHCPWLVTYFPKTPGNVWAGWLVS